VQPRHVCTERGHQYSADAHHDVAPVRQRRKPAQRLLHGFALPALLGECEDDIARDGGNGLENAGLV
jgi:hypothetical protein